MRNGQAKPNVDWTTIQKQYVAGYKAFSLSKMHPVSRQAIDKKIKKEGWLQEGKLDYKNVVAAKKIVEVKTATATKTDATKEMIVKSSPVQMFSKDTPEVREEILRHIAEGVPKGISSETSGISEKTFYEWIRKDESFAISVRAAERKAVADRVQRIGLAGKRGDWKADSWYLERTQKQIFGNETNKLGAMNLHININRDTSLEPVTINAETVDEPTVIDN